VCSYGRFETLDSDDVYDTIDEANDTIERVRDDTRDSR